VLCGAIVYSVRNGVGDPWLKVDPSASSVTFTRLECRYPTPLSTGGSHIRRDATLLYAINGNEISVSSQDGQDNFGFELRAEMSDASGGTPPKGRCSPRDGRALRLRRNEKDILVHVNAVDLDRQQIEVVKPDFLPRLHARRRQRHGV
jgi:hypothetical protein